MRYYCDPYRHLVCVPFSIENLHKMADDLDIARCWYHAGKHPHYDIPKLRYVEIRSRCRVVSEKTIVNIIMGYPDEAIT